MQLFRGCLLAAFEEGEVGVVAHQANCFCNFGAGIAKSIKLLYPEAYQADLETVVGDSGKLGTFTKAETAHGVIYNLYGQYRYGRGGVSTQYDMLTKALEAMAKDLRDAGYSGKIGLPLIGCGLAGGNWDVVSKIIDSVLGDFKVVVYVV